MYNKYLVGLIFGAIAFMPNALHAEEMQLKVGWLIDSKEDPANQAFQAWVDQFNEEGKGLLQISRVVYPSAIPAGEQGNAVRSGVLELLVTAAGYLGGLVPGIEGLMSATVEPTIQRENGGFSYFDEYFQENMNAKYLGTYGYGVNFNLFTNKAIRSLEDLKGMRLRTTTLYTPFFESLGASTVEMPRSEIYTAMERGVVDGYANVSSSVVSQGWSEVTDYMVQPGFYEVVNVLLANKDVWEKMSQEQQDFLVEQGKLLETTYNDMWIEGEAKMLEQLKEKGLEVTELPESEAVTFFSLSDEALWKSILDKTPDRGPKLRELTH